MHTCQGWFPGRYSFPWPQSPVLNLSTNWAAQTLLLLPSTWLLPPSSTQRVIFHGALLLSFELCRVISKSNIWHNGLRGLLPFGAFVRYVSLFRTAYGFLLLLLHPYPIICHLLIKDIPETNTKITSFWQAFSLYKRSSQFAILPPPPPIVLLGGRWLSNCHTCYICLDIWAIFTPQQTTRQHMHTTIRPNWSSLLYCEGARNEYWL